jgi:hypothetical protein
VSVVGLTTGSWRHVLLTALSLSVLAANPAVTSTSHHEPAERHARLVSCRGALVRTDRLEQTSRLLELRTPREPELNGETFSVVVTGYDLAPCVPGAVGPGLAAPPGHDVAIVSVIVEQSGTSRLSPDLALVAASRSFRLPASVSGSATYALAVPARTNVRLQASEAGLTQSFSLRSGGLVGPVPEALYRSPLGPDLVEAMHRAATFETVVGRRQERFQVLLDAVTLGDFSPSGRQAPAGFGWLAVDLLDASGPSVPDWLRVLPASRVRLELLEPLARPVRARAVFNELGGDFSFLVPAGVVRAVLQVSPGVLTVGGRRVEVAGTGRFPVVLPAPPRWLQALEGATIARNRRGASAVSTTVIIGAAAGGSSLVVVPVLLIIPWRRRRQMKKGPYALAATGDAVTPTVARTATPAVETAPPAVHQPVLPPGLGFRVLGPVEVVGLELPTKRPVVVELLCLLALERERRWTADEIMSALWPLDDDGTERVSVATFRSYVSAARRSAGAVALPKNEQGAYRIGDDVWTDWALFTGLTERARGADDKDERLLLAEALSYVRGQVFSGVPNGRYTWAVTSGLVSQMERAVKDAACRLADLALEEGCPAEALPGLRAALSATKDAEVADDLVTASGATGDLAELERAWRDVAASGVEVARLAKNYETIRRRLLGLPVGG